MKKVLKWVAIIGFIVFVLGFAMTYKLYAEIKNTAQEMYTPIQDEVSPRRVEAVNVTAKEPFSALILGVDEREGDSGRSDTMIVLTVNPTLETTKIVSIPRDTYTEIIGKNFKDKINHAYSFGGIEMSVKTVESLLNIPIDYVAQINMESFKDIIEIVDGITVENTFEFDYEGEHFPIGELTLDGESALKYVRMRYEDPTGDFGRQNRQKQVIQGVIKKSLTLNTLFNYKSIFKTLEENVEINVVFDDILSIRKNYSSSFNTIEQHYMNNGTGTKMNGIYYYIPDEQELETLQTILKSHLGM
ncbi:LCP family protein [Solibacillus sp. CAU 1738]|uniref:LCP family glycopolymer transferase n=1 Tax=Solibacillus sp. CAU 1738 TaxID=3140363 RepID=UPI0032601480